MTTEPGINVVLSVLNQHQDVLLNMLKMTIRVRFYEQILQGKPTKYFGNECFAHFILYIQYPYTDEQYFLRISS